MRLANSGDTAAAAAPEAFTGGCAWHPIAASIITNDREKNDFTTFGTIARLSHAIQAPFTTRPAASPSRAAVADLPKMRHLDRSIAVLSRCAVERPPYLFESPSTRPHRTSKSPKSVILSEVWRALAPDAVEGHRETPYSLETPRFQPQPQADAKNYSPPKTAAPPAANSPPSRYSPA